MNIDFYNLTEEEVLKIATPKNFSEKYILTKFLNEVGEVSTVRQISNFFKISKTHIYRGIEENRLIAYKSGSKTLVLSKTILNIVRKKDTE